MGQSDIPGNRAGLRYRDTGQTFSRFAPGIRADIAGTGAGVYRGTGQEITGSWGRFAVKTTGTQGRCEAVFGSDLGGLAGCKEGLIKI